MHRSQPPFRRTCFSFPSQFCLSNNQPCIPTSLVFFFHRTHRYTTSNLDRTAHIASRTRLDGRQPFIIIIWAFSDLAPVPYRRTIPNPPYFNRAFSFFFPIPSFLSFLPHFYKHRNIHSYHRHFTALSILLPLGTVTPASRFYPVPSPIRCFHSMPTTSIVCMGCEMGAFDLFFFSVSSPLLILRSPSSRPSSFSPFKAHYIWPVFLSTLAHHCRPLQHVITLPVPDSSHCSVIRNQNWPEGLSHRSTIVCNQIVHKHSRSSMKFAHHSCECMRLRAREEDMRNTHKCTGSIRSSDVWWRNGWIWRNFWARLDGFNSSCLDQQHPR